MNIGPRICTCQVPSAFWREVWGGHSGFLAFSTQWTIIWSLQMVFLYLNSTTIECYLYKNNLSLLNPYECCIKSNTSLMCRFSTSNWGNEKLIISYETIHRAGHCGDNLTLLKQFTELGTVATIWHCFSANKLSPVTLTTQFRLRREFFFVF